MSKKQEPATSLEKRGSTALAAPSFITKGDTRGTENITSQDIRPPMLRVAQDGSPETKERNEAAYVDGLEPGMLFVKSGAGATILGEGPVEIVVVNQLGHRHVEFAPMDSGGGVIDFNVPDGDPRTLFTEGEKDGKKVRVKPVATKFYDYLVLVNVEGNWELAAFSLKSTMIKVAVAINTELKKYKMPSFAHVFTVVPTDETRGAYRFYGVRVDRKGWVDEETYNNAAALYDQMSGKKVVLETEGEGREPGSDDEAIPY